MSEVKVHVESLDAFAERSLDDGATARSGRTRRRSRRTSRSRAMEALLKVLTPAAGRSLRRLRADGPSSIRALARALGRDYRGVHADVMALIEAGLIDARRGREDLGPVVADHGGDGARHGRMTVDPRPDDPGHRQPCRQVGDGGGAVPGARAARAEGRAVQAAEHVEQRGGDGRRRRDRPGAGAAGAGLPGCRRPST